MDGRTPGLAVYRFAIEEVFRLQEHVFNEQGERLLSLTERLGSVPKDSYAALSTADARFPTITLSTGESTQVSYGQYRKLLATCRSQDDRRKAYEALYDTYTASLNTYAAIYNGVMHGDWFEARARGYQTTLDAALFGNAIPTSVVENLIRETKNGVAPFRRYHQLRKRVLNLADYYVFDAFVPLVEHDVKVRLRGVLDWIVRGGVAARLGVPGASAARVLRALDRRLRKPGQAQRRLLRAGVRSQSVHADELQRHARRRVHARARARPLDAHDALTRDAAVRLFGLHHLRRRGAVDAERSAAPELHAGARDDQEERVVLLQHAIDNIVSTFYNQVLFADFELEAHRLVETDQPITSEMLSGIYRKLLGEYWGDALSPDPRAQHTWARIPHFFQSPYYVYQYATCFASTAKLMERIGSKEPRARGCGRSIPRRSSSRAGRIIRWTLLKRAGVDLSQPETVRAVSAQLDGLVDRLEKELQ